jgi:hypothetical protein
MKDRQVEADKPRSKTPDLVRKDKPQPTLDMGGPIGHAVRGREFVRQLQRDRTTENARAMEAKNFADKADAGPLASNEDVRGGKRGLLRPRFPKQKSNDERSR